MASLSRAGPVRRTRQLSRATLIEALVTSIPEDPRYPWRRHRIRQMLRNLSDDNLIHAWLRRDKFPAVWRRCVIWGYTTVYLRRASLIAVLVLIFWALRRVLHL